MRYRNVKSSNCTLGVKGQYLRRGRKRKRWPRKEQLSVPLSFQSDVFARKLTPNCHLSSEDPRKNGLQVPLKPDVHKTQRL